MLNPCFSAQNPNPWFNIDFGGRDWLFFLFGYKTGNKELCENERPHHLLITRGIKILEK